MADITAIRRAMTTMQFHAHVEALLSFLPSRVAYAGIHHIVLELPDLHAFTKAIQRLAHHRFYCEVPHQRVEPGSQARFLKVRRTWP